MARARSILGILAATGAVIAGLGVAAPASATAGPSDLVYNSIDSSNLKPWSQGFGSSWTVALGDAVTLAAGGRVLSAVDVEMVDWACGSGSWSGTDCVTAPGATFDQPLTISLYAVTADGHRGDELVSSTQTFAIPFRPSYDDTNCSGDTYHGYWDAAHSTCRHNVLSTVTFTGFSGVTLPDQVIAAVSFPTTATDPSIPATEPANSLNVGLTLVGPSVGADIANDVWVDGQAPWSDSFWTAADNTFNGGATDGLRRSTSTTDWTVDGTTWFTPQIAIHATIAPAPTESATPTPSATPFVPTGDELTTSNTHNLTVTGNLVPGGAVTLTDAALAGVTGDAFVFSTPTSLGSVTFSAAGTAPATLPAGLSAGAHRIAVYAADGSVLGWASITVTAVLAETGSNTAPYAAFGIAAVLAGAVLFVISRRKAATQR
ncbi:MAG TPA: LPXTG cell wall anchor domain-containing protein [Candidatus Limnocylindrales bacterium]